MARRRILEQRPEVDTRHLSHGTNSLSSRGRGVLSHTAPLLLVPTTWGLEPAEHSSPWLLLRFEGFDFETLAVLAKLYSPHGGRPLEGR